jgi:hypothetical protein
MRSEIQKILGGVSADLSGHPGGQVVINISGDVVDNLVALFEKMCKEVIGEELPTDQPFDDDMDTITRAAHRIFREGANWTKDRQTQALKTKLGAE